MSASIAATAPLLSATEAVATAAELAERLAPGAAERDHTGELPVAALAEIDRSGLLALRVPALAGGPEVPWSVAVETVRAIAAADPALAQPLQGHLLQLDVAALLGDDGWRERVFATALAGGRLASVLAERGGVHAQDLRTRLVPERGRLILDGVKHYATGAGSAALIAVSALDPDGRVVLVLVERDQPGVEFVPEWHAMGQRATVSGTVTLDAVEIATGAVLPYWRAFARPQSFGARAQLVHAAISTGIARGALDDAVAFVRERARPFAEAHAAGLAPTAAEDPQVVARAGRLAVQVRAAERLLEGAAAAADRAEGWPSDADAAADLSLLVAEAKAFSAEVSVTVASELFALGGAASTDRRLGLDRHWRNARTHSVHDPADWKYHHIGAHLLSGRRPPNHGQI